MNLRTPSFKVDALNLSTLNSQKMLPKGILSSYFLKAWKDGFTGKDIVIAVIDTGIDGSHPDLKDKVIKSFNLIGGNVTESHGTHVAGTICANGWLVGGAYDAKLIDIRVIGPSGGSIDNVVKGIELAIENNVQIINMSIGTETLSKDQYQRLVDVINKAWQNGIICVAASGNAGKTVCSVDPYEYPASIQTVESVTACEVGTNLDDIKLAPFSNENDRVDISACGRYVLSSILGGKYALYSGTSMATPHISAMLAVLAQELKSKYPKLSGSSFSSNLLSMLHNNVYKVLGCAVVSKQLSTCLVANSDRNISFGLGFARYHPDSKIDVPGQQSYNNGIYVGNLISSS